MYNYSMDSKECLQLNNEFEMTPCFCMAGKTPCSLNFCPAKEWLKMNPEGPTEKALHFYCVLSKFYDYQNIFQVGKGEFLTRTNVL